MEVDQDKTQDESDKKSEIPGFSSINEFSQESLKTVLQATRSSNDLPVGDDYDFYSTFSSVRDVMEIEGSRILTLLQRILRYQNVKGNIGPSSTSMELEERFDVLIDANDQMLERIGTSLDEAAGVKKQETKLVLASTPRVKVSTSWNKKVVTPTNTSKTASAYRLLTGRNVFRPQVRFKDKIDNSNTPFKPLLREKPNASKSLEDSLKLPEAVTIEESETPEFLHPHPYSYEIEEFSPGVELLVKVKPQEPQPISLTPLCHVDKPDQLERLVDDLMQETVIAVDLEHHAYRSFQGLTCLMQISTRSRDFIVDVLELWGEMSVLNKVFTDPKITKVFHGADSDIIWLQRDLGLYIVNLFDTGQAARVLCLSRFSLAHLLFQYCHVEADKQFQLADWRIRPLPQELTNYAREDTHYLLYIYDMMRNQLLDSGNSQANLLHSVYNRSKLVASQVYRKPVFRNSDYLELYKKSRKAFNNQQLAALKDLHQWRDKLARLEDESLGYVLPNHMLLQIAEILPREHQGVLACCNPIPPLVRQNLPELHKMVLSARELTLAKIEKIPGSQPSVAQHPKYDTNSVLNCRHDLTRQGEAIGDIEKSIAVTGLIADRASMFDGDNQFKCEVEILQSPIVSAFALSHTAEKPLKETKAMVEKINTHFSNPFTKFLAKETNTCVVNPEHKDMWLLKGSTNKKKLDKGKDKVDLDSFEPEYAPPAKRPKVTVNLSTSAPTTEKNSKSIFGDIAVDDGSTASSQEDIKNKITSRLQTLREEVQKAKQMMRQKEKEKEAVEKADNPSSETVSSNRQDTKRKKKKKKEKPDRNVEFKEFDYEAAEKEIKIEMSSAKKMDIYNPRLPSRDKKKKGKVGMGKGKGKAKAGGAV